MLSVARLFFLIMMSIISLSSYSQTGPGGVATSDGTSGLLYWIDANRGTTGTPVTALQDLSGNGVTNTIHGNLVFVSNALNNFGVLRFDGDDDIETDFSINATSYPDLTVIAVYLPRIALAGSVWGEDNGGWDRFLTDINLVPTLNASVGAGYDHSSTFPSCYNIGGLFDPGFPTLSNVTYREDDLNGTVVRLSGVPALAFTSTADNYNLGPGTGYSNFYVGAIGSNGFRFDGDIAEVIVFDNALSTTEQLIIENYLSAKYDIALADVNIDVYRGDDSGFDFDVAGIGMTAGVSHEDSRGTGIVRMWSPNNLDNDEFLMWGHNNGAISAINPDVPMSMSARSNRIWMVSEMDLLGGAANVGIINISFDLTGLGPVVTSQLRLLVDTNGDGLFADEIPRAGASSLGNGEYAFNNVTSISHGVRFTIGTTNSNQTPLPIELADFYALVNGSKHRDAFLDNLAGKK
jgi:hypothetical protein